MKKIRLLIALIAAILGSVQGTWAERVAPTFPQAQTLESGKTYYLYNVGSGRFLTCENSVPYARPNPTEQVKIGTINETTYYIQFTKSGRYFNANSSSTNTGTAISTWEPFKISNAEDGYYIQRAYQYNEYEYLGFNGNSNNMIMPNLTSGNIVWQLYDEDIVRYYAKKALYDALEASTGYEFAIGEYEAIYENEASTNSELNAAATALNKSLGMSNGYQAPWWNERPILFYTADGDFGQGSSYTWTLNNHPTYFERYIGGKVQSSISATVMVEEPSTLVYGLNGQDEWFKVYVDGVEVRSLHNVQHRIYPSDKTHTRFFEDLEPGLHTITWTCIRNSTSSYSNFYLYNVGVMSKQQITVSLLEPGSLGTEVLYNTDHIKNVRRLKVKGAMNSDDWGRIKMMSTLLELDLSEAQITEIPASQFKVSSSDTTMNFLHKIVLPEGLKTIGDYAFYESFVEDINLPSTMKRVGQEAFCRSHVKELIMPDDMTDFYGGDNYGYCFKYMYWLQKLVMPKNLTRIPNQTFYEGYYITEAVMPEKLQTVGQYAFSSCQRMQTTLPEGLKTIEKYGFSDCPTLNSPLPSTLTTIGEHAFEYARGYKSLVIPQSVTSIGQYAFENCTNIETAELSVNQYSLANGVFQGCSKLKTMKLNSPTVITISSTYPLSDITAVTIQVPHYLVNEYKLHSYWYNAKAIEPFDYSDVDYIPINANLTLNHERFGGQPTIWMQYNTYLKINGDIEQKFQDISVANDYPNNRYSQILSNCTQLTGYGDNVVRYHTAAKKWYFISLPFDLKVSDIYNYHDAQFAIRFYDGASRAINGKSGNWKNYTSTDIIPAGTGFIFQTNIDVWSYFPAVDNENKFLNTIGVTEFNKTLAVNASETTSNKGWNLVGNPYQCYYNNHCLNFTAPITIWSPDNKTYTAYSLTDDDYAIRPNEAFFVQCPNEEYNTIGFPLQGRQLTSVIESQNAVKAWAPEAKTRQVVNLSVSNGEMEDMTRVVLNEEASMAYETACDASKFMSIDGSVPQIYTLDAEGTPYSINERPIGEGTVALGFYAGQTGDFTISVTRCDAEQVFITDNLTGEIKEITNSAYIFSAKAGTNDTRFTLTFVSNDPTAIATVEQSPKAIEHSVYDLQGRQIGNGQSSNRKLPGIYVVRQGNKASKVIVR